MIDEVASELKDLVGSVRPFYVWVRDCTSLVLESGNLRRHGLGPGTVCQREH